MVFHAKQQSQNKGRIASIFLLIFVCFLLKINCILFVFIVGLGMDVATFEQKVFEVDGILIRIRASSAAHVQDYSYVRAAPANTTISEWLRARIYPLLNGYECDVINGQYGPVHGGMNIGNVRATYR